MVSVFFFIGAGFISPGPTTYLTSIGLIKIAQEPSTTDEGFPLSSRMGLQPPNGPVPMVFNGLMFGGKESKIALRAGVTKSITAPIGSQFFKGYSTFFSLGSPHKLVDGTILSKTAAFHVTVDHTGLQVLR